MVALEAVVSAFSYATQALLLAVLVTAGFLLPADEPKQLRRALVISSVYLVLAFLLISLVALLIQGSQLQGGRMPSGDTLFRYVSLTQSGRIWLAREIFAVLLAVVAFGVTKGHKDSLKIRLLALAVLPLIVSRSFMSHAIAVRENTEMAVAADATHLLATSLWTGGLPVLAAALYSWKKYVDLPRGWAAKLVGRFSRMALISVAVLALTGMYSSWIQVGQLSRLFDTAYGNVLLLKVVLVIVMLGFGAINFFSTRRKLSDPSNTGTEPRIRKQALTLIGAEASLAVVVFFVTGLLTVLPPGIHALHESALASPRPAALAPAEGASVKIVSPKRGEVFSTDSVPLNFTLVRGKRGNHVHTYVDGELIGMFVTDGMLNGIPRGRHRLELRVVAGDHETELEAKDQTDFVVK